ncbi:MULTISPECIES: hypothetical protein [Vibrio]|uniref:hypothetical protein n=1 Tax=Vibrio TaxID=662 RepID=UPI0004DEEF34|nr:hypothetical protein [Vibrio parahaemolyticus]EGQ9239986.1 hypothetical protein [Vibrio vulnificus]ELC9582599.1 hypothetical protein [Vibrio vulnificus]HDY7429257.1 hypothetical protein [Vibrio vulnificus]HDY7489104.1 hypothetical protein [Vibrio vulnificus]HDY7951815.1 hypothetical protein [Vibrio vulnificus]
MTSAPFGFLKKQGNVMNKAIFFSTSGALLDNANSSPHGCIDVDPSVSNGVGVYYLHTSNRLDALARLLKDGHVQPTTKVYNLAQRKLLGTVQHLIEVCRVLVDVVSQLNPVLYYEFHYFDASEMIECMPFEFLNSDHHSRLLSKIVYGSQVVWERNIGWSPAVVLELVKWLVTLIDHKSPTPIELDWVSDKLSNGRNPMSLANDILSIGNSAAKVHAYNGDIVDVELQAQFAPAYRAQIILPIEKASTVNVSVMDKGSLELPWKDDLLGTLQELGQHNIFNH